MLKYLMSLLEHFGFRQMSLHLPRHNVFAFDVVLQHINVLQNIVIKLCL
jgi:hypothetical protein